MPDWNSLNNEIKAAGSTHDLVRRKYLRRLHRLTGRNIIIYYSGWLQKRGLDGVEVNDADKNGLMTVVHGLDRSRGLDLLLHTPGGETAATESLVNYLRSMFGMDIRAIVPQLAMSGGTMIACACREIYMGKQSSLGPIDPQYRGIPAHGVVEEFDQAYKEIKKDPAKIPVWQPILAKYSPTLIGECIKAIEWSSEMVTDWLLTGMFKDEPASPEVRKKVQRIVNDLGDHALSKSHARHLSLARCQEIGLKVVALERDQRLQDAVLSVHHACIHTLGATPAFKIIENHTGLFMLQVASEIEHLTRDSHAMERMCLNYASIGPCGQLRKEIAMAVARQALEQPERIRTHQQFIAAGERAWGRLTETGHELIALVDEILEVYQQVARALDRDFPHALWAPVKQMRQHLAELVYPGFIAQTPPQWLRHYPRYLRGIALRLKKLTDAGLQRDQQAAAIVEPLADRYRQRIASHRRAETDDPALSEYRWMLEELRISLFAQELKTAMPISAQRMEKQWAQVQSQDRWVRSLTG